MSVFTVGKHAKPLKDEEFCIESWDASLNGEHAHSLKNQYELQLDDFNQLFFARYQINYISQYLIEQDSMFRVVTHPSESNTCFEKAQLLSQCDPLHVIKTLYFEYSENHLLYAIVIPETGCFVNKEKLKEQLDLQGNGFLRKAQSLPQQMSFGTCSPFITQSDIQQEGIQVEKIVFDSETLALKKDENALDDFSFGDDHRMSLQMNYYHCFQMLKALYPENVVEKEILSLSFKEKFTRTKGKISINYEFNSINYGTAKFINSINEFGDVSIINDYVDEIDLPNILKRSD